MEVLCFDPCILYHLPLAIQSDCDSRRLTRKHYTFVDFFFTWMIQVKKKSTPVIQAESQVWW